MIASNSSTENSKSGYKRRRTVQLDAADSNSSCTTGFHDKKPPPAGHKVNNINHVKKKLKQNTTQSANKNEIKRPKQQLPLTGKLIAVTSLQSHNSNNTDNPPSKNHAHTSTCASSNSNDNDNNNNDNATYAQLVATCRDKAGADTTSQVHRRVFCLIATTSAIAGETQRVRKAWKLNIPVVRVAWLHDCIQQGQLIDFTTTTTANNNIGYVASPPLPKSSKATTTALATTANCCEDTAAKPKDDDGDDDDATADNAGGWSEEVDLGCCCVCHDNASPPTDCPWCVECSVNLACVLPAARQHHQPK